MLTKCKTEDLKQIWQINQAFVPMVSSVELKWFEQILEQSPYFYVFKDKEKVLAFILALTPGLDYLSLNYQWFSSKYGDDFLYVDRIAVLPDYQKKGLGKILYEELEKNNQDKFSRITCEVNIKPRNQNSLDFHHRLGFQEVGQQDTDNQTKRVSLLSKELATI